MSCGGNRQQNRNAQAIHDAVKASNGVATVKLARESFHSLSRDAVTEATTAFVANNRRSPDRDESKAITQAAHAAARGRLLQALTNGTLPAPADSAVRAVQAKGSGKAATYVFRAGEMVPGVLTGETAVLTAQTDALRPRGRTGRNGSLFASPSMLGVTRWVRGNSLVSAACDPHQVRVNPDEVFVYSVDAWERASGTYSTDAHRAAYWESGIPLSDWEEQAAARGLDPREWEVLVPVTQVVSDRPISDKRLLASLPDDDWTKDQLANDLDRMRRYRVRRR